MNVALRESTMHIDGCLTYRDLIELAEKLGNPPFIFVDLNHWRIMLEKFRTPPALLYDGTAVMGLRVEKTLFLPIWEGKLTVHEVILDGVTG